MSREIILATLSAGGADNVFGCVTDPQSGLVERAFKGEPTVKGGHGTVGSDLIVACHSTKPLINVWTWSKDQVYSRLPCPGQVSALQCSHDGVYCVAGISEKLYVWQFPVGNLLAVLSGHYQVINVLRFVDDSSLFLSGGDDNLVLVWQTASVVSAAARGRPPHPLHVWSSHSLPVTDIHCGFGGMRARVITSSLDQTCKIWELSSGQLLCSIMFDSGITSITTDAAEFRLFAGTLSGDVKQINFYEQPSLPNSTVQDASRYGPLIFNGHRQQVSSLAVSLDGSFLVSGSSDATVRVWHIGSQQCLKVLKQRGPVAGVSLLLRPQSLAGQLSPGTCVIQPLKRTVHAVDVGSQSWGSELGVNGTVPVRLTSLDDVEYEVGRKHDHGQQKLSNLTRQEEDEQDIREQMEKLKRTNGQLYQFVVQQLARKTCSKPNEEGL